MTRQEAQKYAVRFVNDSGHYSLPVWFADLETARRCARRPDVSSVRFEIALDGRCVEFDSYVR